MSDFDNTNRGAVWKNDDKQSEKHPDFKGSINIEGVEYWVSGWRRRAGASPKSPALSLSVTMKESKAPQISNQMQQQQQPQHSPADDSCDDDMPF